MDEKDRKLMLKIARKVNDLETWKNEHEKIHGTPVAKDGDLAPLQNIARASGEPDIMIHTEYKAGMEQQGVMRAPVVHQNLRDVLIKLCRLEGIRDMQITFKDTQQ